MTTSAQCGYTWPLSDEEKAADPIADCDHTCRLVPHHDGRHECCQGRAFHD